MLVVLMNTTVMGYDPSYIREFHMLVTDSCIMCKGTIWPDVFPA